MPLIMEDQFRRTINEGRLRKNSDYAEEVYYHFGDEKRSIGAWTPTIQKTEESGSTFITAIWGSEVALEPFEYTAPADEGLFIIDGELNVIWPDGKAERWVPGELMSNQRGERFTVHWSKPFKVFYTCFIPTADIPLFEDQRQSDAG